MNEVPKKEVVPEEVVLDPGETIVGPRDNPAVIVYNGKEFAGRTHFDALQEILDEDIDADPEKMNRFFRTTAGRLLTENQALRAVDRGRVRPGAREDVVNAENLDAPENEE